MIANFAPKFRLLYLLLSLIAIGVVLSSLKMFNPKRVESQERSVSQTLNSQKSTLNPNEQIIELDARWRRID